VKPKFLFTLRNNLDFLSFVAGNLSNTCSNKVKKITIITVMMWVIQCQAQLGGLTSFTHLNIPGSARIAAMGGSYFTMKDGDVHLSQFNPSLLDSNMHNKLGMSFVDYFDGIAMGYATYARQIKPKITAGATMQYLNYGKQQELDALGYEIGQFQASDYVLTLGAGYQIDSLWSFGVNFKTMYSALANYASVAVALDGAVTYSKPSKGFAASMIVSNLGAQLTTYTSDQREKLPFQMQIGIVKRPAHAPFRLSLVYSNMQQWNIGFVNPNATIITDPITGEVIEQRKWEFGDDLMRHITVGSEFILSKNLNLRVGYNYRRRQELKLEDKPGTAGFSYGFGVKVSKFHLSYGRAIYHLAGPSNHFSVTTAFGDWKQ
jgi:hypothetical protein